VNRIAGRMLLGSLLVMATGCNGLQPQSPQPTSVSVTFINDIADSGVSISFFSSADASVSPDDLTNVAISEQLAFSLDANDAFSFALACTDFQAAVVDRASRIGATGTGATASTGVLVDGMDFACGNFITFTLSSQGPDDLQIDVSIGDTNPLPVPAGAPKKQGNADKGSVRDASATTTSNHGAADGTNSSNTNSNGPTK